jgi:hypothetical protein
MTAASKAPFGAEKLICSIAAASIVFYPYYHLLFHELLED